VAFYIGGDELGLALVFWGLKALGGRVLDELLLMVTVSLTLGSLTSKDLRDLEELGLLPKEALEDAENDKEKIDNVVPVASSSVLNGPGNEGLPWFQTMVEVSQHLAARVSQ
jgi:hypothetical protein